MLCMTSGIHIDKSTFKLIFRDHWSDFVTKHDRYDSEYYHAVVQKMLDCGDPDKMGYAQYRCLNCGATKQVAFSCKSSFCLSCGKVYAEHWVDFISRRMFPDMVYRHIVLTVPDFLRNWFYKNPQLLSVLMQTGKKCMQDVLNSCAGRSLDIGLITVLQTAGRSGAYNPHLHILLTEGGVTSDKTWRTVSYIPFLSSTESGSFICSPCSKRIFPVLKSKKTLTKHGPTTQKALSHLYIKKKSLPAVRGWLSIWQNTSFRLLYQFGVLNSMTDSLLHIGIEITKLTVSCMKQFPYPNLLDEWFSTFCRKGFSEFVITDFTAMYGMFRTENCSPKYFPAIRPFLNPAFACVHVNRSNSFSLIVSDTVLSYAHIATPPWSWN